VQLTDTQCARRARARIAGGCDPAHELKKDMKKEPPYYFACVILFTCHYILSKLYNIIISSVSRLIQHRMIARNTCFKNILRASDDIVTAHLT
jgi:hypothetical protein